MLRIGCVLLMLWLAGANAAEHIASPRHYLVEVPSLPGIQEQDFFASLLRRALEASKAPGEVIDLSFSGQSFSQARWIAEVQKGQKNSVIWTVTSRQREQVLRPVRIPLFKGLLGYRLLVIRRDDLPVFAAINTKADLMQLTAGQGSHWPDTQVLKDNQLPVMEGMTQDNLYRMLAAKRFDYFPRGITEVGAEADLIRRGNLVIEPKLLMVYPTAMYFFVNKQNKALADRLERGLGLLIKSGEFDRMLHRLPRVQTALEILQRGNRRTIVLTNPDLPEQTPLGNSSYWLSLP